MTESNIQQVLDLAIRLHQSGRLTEAEPLYRQILVQQPQHSKCLDRLGVLALQRGRRGEAEDLIRKAVALAPGEADYRTHLGVALATSGRIEEAIVAFRDALGLNPDHAEAHYNLANALKEKGELPDAIDAYHRAISLRPKYVEAYYNLGLTLRRQGLPDEAFAAFRQALALRPGHADTLNNLANALLEAGRADEAIDVYRQLLIQMPASAEAHYNLANACKQQGNLDAALSAFHRAGELGLDRAELHLNLGNTLKAAGQIDEAIECYRRASQRTDESWIAGALLYSLYFHPDYDAPMILEEHQRWNQRFARPLRGDVAQPRSAVFARRTKPRDGSTAQNRKLRIGYVSPEFRDHPVGRFMLPLLTRHDRSRIEVFCYSDAAHPDALTDRLRAHADAWRVTTRCSDEQLAKLIGQDRIDILVDLTLHLEGTRLMVFAQKPALVQVAYLAYCGTSGLETIDYRLTDPYLDPDENPQEFYSEQSIRLPQSYWCYMPPDLAPEVGPLPALSNGYVTFGCLNNFAKASRVCVALWRQLLLAAPRSRLLVHSFEGSHRQRFIEQFAADGIDPSRVEFVGRLPMKEYLAQYQRIDVALDTFPYGGGTTTCDALWMGVPVVSLTGTTAVSRAGLSILSNGGLSDLVAGAPDQYVAIAAQVAADLDRLKELRRTLRDRLRSSPLMDAPAFARGVEAAYRQMWRRYCVGETPG